MWECILKIYKLVRIERNLKVSKKNIMHISTSRWKKNCLSIKICSIFKFKRGHLLFFSSQNNIFYFFFFFWLEIRKKFHKKCDSWLMKHNLKNNKNVRITVKKSVKCFNFVKCFWKKINFVLLNKIETCRISEESWNKIWYLWNQGKCTV